MSLYLIAHFFHIDIVSAVFTSQYDIKPFINAYTLAYVLRKEEFVLLHSLILFFTIIGRNILLSHTDTNLFFQWMSCPD